MKKGNFNIDNVPQEIQLNCLKKMYTDYYATKLMSNEEEYKKFGEPFIYLAWLWVNELYYIDHGWIEPFEGYELNHDYYELEDGGWNYYLTVDNYNIEDTKPFLKGLFLN